MPAGFTLNSRPLGTWTHDYIPPTFLLLWHMDREEPGHTCVPLHGAAECEPWCVPGASRWQDSFCALVDVQGSWLGTASAAHQDDLKGRAGGCHAQLKF
jgi:hypothetical protein